MTTLNPQQIAQLAYNAGFRGDALRWAVAVALAESGGRTDAYNPEVAAGTSPGSGSRGLWQIYGTAHPQYNSSIAFDPAINAKAAYQVYREAGNRFTPWSTYTQGLATNYYKSLGNLSVTTSPQGIKDIGQTITANLINAPSRVASSVQAIPQTVTNAQAATVGALNDIASGKFIYNAVNALFGKFDKVSFAFYMGGLILIVIGLIVLFQKQIGDVTVAGTNAVLLANGASPIIRKGQKNNE